MLAHDEGDDRDEDICKLDLKEMVVKTDEWGNGKGKVSVRIDNKVTSNHDLVEFDSIGLLKIIVNEQIFAVRLPLTGGSKSMPGPVDTTVGAGGQYTEEAAEASFRKIPALKDTDVQVSAFTVAYVARIKCFTVGGIKGGNEKGKTEKGTAAKKSGVFMSFATETQSATEDFEATTQDLEDLKE